MKDAEQGMSKNTLISSRT